MGLFRTAIIVGAVVALMPSDRNSQAQLYERAAAAAKWTVTFCDRNGEMCRQGGELWGTFVKKAEFAGQMVVQLIQEQATRRSGGEVARSSNGGDERDAEPVVHRVRPLERRERDVPSIERREEPVLERRGQGTLNDEDLRPQWRAREREPRRGY